MKHDIPNKQEREEYEIKNFISAYSRIKKNKYCIIKKLDDNAGRSVPDYLICDVETNEKIIVELTSVYIDDHSFIKRHWQEDETTEEMSYSKEDVESYKKRVLEHIKNKSQKAKKYPLNGRRLVLSVYLNEHEGIYVKPKDWENYLKKYEKILDSLSPINEILLWIPCPGWGDPLEDDYKSLLIVI